MIQLRRPFFALRGLRDSETDSAQRLYAETTATPHWAETFPAALDDVRAYRAFMPTAAADLSDR